jgi:hypothetical protein
MLGSTPPWVFVTPDNSSSFLKRKSQKSSKAERDQIEHRPGLPDGKQEVPGVDAEFLVVPCSVHGVIKDLLGEVLPSQRPCRLEPWHPTRLA